MVDFNADEVAILEPHDIKDMSIKELRTACREYGLSPAGGIDTLKERLNDAMAQLVAHLEGLSTNDVDEGVEPESYSFKMPGEEDYEEEPPAQAREERSYLKSDNVKHMFGVETAEPEFRTGKRVVVQDYDGLKAAGQTAPSPPQKPPPTGPPAKFGAFNSEGVDHLFKETYTAPPPTPPPAAVRGPHTSDGAREALTVVDPPEPPPTAPPPPTPPPPSAAALDEETMEMLKGLTVPELRTMLRKRGISPAGSLQVLRDRLTNALLGVGLDTEVFEEVPSGVEWPTEEKLYTTSPAKPANKGVRILGVHGGGPSSLNYIFGGEA